MDIIIQFFGGGGHYMLDDTLEDGTIIAIYSQMSQGNPVAKSWGTWTNGVLKAETFEAFDPADAWDNHIHQQEMALEAYQEYLDYSGEEPLMTLEEWMEWQADLEDEYLEQQWKDMQEEDEPSPEDDPEYTTLEGTLDSETFESPVSCKICGKTFDSFRGLNGHMNAHIPSHRKRAETFEAESEVQNDCYICGDGDGPACDADGCQDKHYTYMLDNMEAEECEHEWKMTELPLERGHKYDVGWVNAAGITSYHMVCIKCNYCTECSGTHGFLAETFEQLPYEIITTDWKSSIAPEHRPNNDNWFITGDTIFAVPDSEGNYGRGEETIVRISTYGEGTTLDEAKENGIFRATEYLYDDYSRGYFTQNAETFEADSAPSVDV